MAATSLSAPVREAPAVALTTVTNHDGLEASPASWVEEAFDAWLADITALAATIRTSTYTSPAVPPEPALGTWVRDKYGATAMHQIPHGWGKRR